MLFLAQRYSCSSKVVHWRFFLLLLQQSVIKSFGLLTWKFFFSANIRRSKYYLPRMANEHILLLESTLRIPYYCLIIFIIISINFTYKIIASKNVCGNVGFSYCIIPFVLTPSYSLHFEHVCVYIGFLCFVFCTWFYWHLKWCNIPMFYYTSAKEILTKLTVANRIMAI